ncbi:MAG: GtrA family protein [Gaiellaceae bacterium]
MSVAVQRAARPARFLVVGAAGYAINLVTFALLVGAGFGYVLASVLSYAVSNALMYLGNRYFTFRLGNDGFWSAYARYLLVGLAVIVMNAAVLALLVEGLELDETLAQALSLLAVTPAAYLMFKRWTFRLTT